MRHQTIWLNNTAKLICFQENISLFFPVFFLNPLLTAQIKKKKQKRKKKNRKQNCKKKKKKKINV